MDQENRGAGRFSECHFGASTKKRMTSSKKEKKKVAQDEWSKTKVSVNSVDENDWLWKPHEILIA